MCLTSRCCPPRSMGLHKISKTMRTKFQLLPRLRHATEKVIARQPAQQHECISIPGHIAQGFICAWKSNSLKSFYFVGTKIGALPLYVMFPVIPGTFCGLSTGTVPPSNHKHCVAHEMTSGSKRSSSKNATDNP